MYLINSTNTLKHVVKKHIPDINELTLNRIVNEIIDDSIAVSERDLKRIR